MPTTTGIDPSPAPSATRPVSVKNRPSQAAREARGMQVKAVSQPKQNQAPTTIGRFFDRRA